jgi:hypothetical protein
MSWSARKACRCTRAPSDFRLDVKAILRDKPFARVLASGHPAYIAPPEGVDGVLKVWPDGRRQLVTFDADGERLLADLEAYAGRGAYSVKPRLGRPPKAADGACTGTDK